MMILWPEIASVTMVSPFFDPHSIGCIETSSNKGAGSSRDNCVVVVNVSLARVLFIQPPLFIFPFGLFCTATQSIVRPNFWKSQRDHVLGWELGDSRVTVQEVRCTRDSNTNIPPHPLMGMKLLSMFSFLELYCLRGV
jgi:hypothetical protein